MHLALQLYMTTHHLYIVMVSYILSSRTLISDTNLYENTLLIFFPLGKIQFHVTERKEIDEFLWYFIYTLFI